MRPARHLIFFCSLFLSAFVIMTSCKTEQEQTSAEQARMQIAHLGSGDLTAFAAIRDAFKQRNAGYDIQYFQKVLQLQPKNTHRLAFLQGGGGTGVLDGDSSKVSVGDMIYLQPDKSLQLDSLMDFLVFTVPEALPESIPVFIRPDWDPNITDTPGGCATETNAYRRILLTWLGKNGPYLYHALNTHRVRIVNSFTHYHPLEGGFDEFYLVQMARPRARIITSEQVPLIVEPDQVKKEDIDGLLQETPLKVGDLVYLPRGVAHRGVDSVLAHVITVPGFIPGSEIGIDHHLRAINEKLSLKGEQQLPYHEAASLEAVIK